MLLHPFEDTDVSKAERAAAFENQADLLTAVYSGWITFFVDWGRLLSRCYVRRNRRCCQSKNQATA